MGQSHCHSQPLRYIMGKDYYRIVGVVVCLTSTSGTGRATVTLIMETPELHSLSSSEAAIPLLHSSPPVPEVWGAPAASEEFTGRREWTSTLRSLLEVWATKIWGV